MRPSTHRGFRLLKLKTQNDAYSLNSGQRGKGQGVTQAIGGIKHWLPFGNSIFQRFLLCLAPCRLFYKPEFPQASDSSVRSVLPIITSTVKMVS